MKTVKLKIRKGISCFLRGYFRVYLFSLALPEGRSNNRIVFRKTNNSYIWRFHCRSTDSSMWQSARLSIRIYTPSVAYRMGQARGENRFAAASPANLSAWRASNP